jgi:hypothetical protein
VATLNNPGPAAFDQFGYAVAISGTRVVVGAYLDDTGALDAGSAYVYDLSSGTPVVPVATLNNPGPAAADQFGFSVAIDGLRAAVGAPGDDSPQADKGSTYIYAPCGRGSIRGFPQGARQRRCIRRSARAQRHADDSKTAPAVPLAITRWSSLSLTTSPSAAARKPQ